MPSCVLHPPFAFFFSNDTAPTEIYTLSLHDALPISLPQGWLHQLTALHPANRACAGSHFYIVIAFRDDIDALSVMHHSHLLADLGDTVQERRDFFADKRFALRFALWAKDPGDQRHQRQQRHGNHEFPLHATLSGVARVVRNEATLSESRSVPPLIRLNSPASSPRLTTPIVLIFAILLRHSSWFAKDCT